MQLKKLWRLHNLISMGGYLLFTIEFKSKEDRDKFENHNFKFFKKFKRMFQYDYDESYECNYYPKWMGYYEPQEIMKECRKNKIKFKRFLSMDLSTQSNWYNEVKQETHIN